MDREQIEQMKVIVSEKELVEDFEEMKKLYDKGDKISLAKFFNRAFYILDTNSYLFVNEEFHGQLLAEIESFRNDAYEIEDALDDYGSGKEITSYYAERRIKELLRKKEVNDFIQMFYIINNESD